MADEIQDGEEDDAPKKKSKKPLIIGLVLLLVGAGAGFGIVSAGLLPGGSEEADKEPEEEKKYEDVAFVPVDPLIVPVGNSDRARVLRFKAQLEVAPGDEAEVVKLMPRVLDVLNSYLRAVDLSSLEDPGALVALRAQMLRRVQIVLGDGLVSDLLVSEFILN